MVTRGADNIFERSLVMIGKGENHSCALEERSSAGDTRELLPVDGPRPGMGGTQ